MQELDGTISNKIRRIFAKGDAAYSPPVDRNDSPTKGQAVPKHAAGKSMTGRKKKK